MLFSLRNECWLHLPQTAAMRRIFLPFTVFLFLLSACGGDTSENNADKEATEVTDSVAVRLDQTREEIEESASNLDQLLEDIE